MIFVSPPKKLAYVGLLIWVVCSGFSAVQALTTASPPSGLETPETILTHYEIGKASWYGKRFHGKRTSCGERFDMHTLTAAHRTLPIPSYAKITNLHNGKTVIVRINDRGPYKKQRIIDLSYAAAHALDFVRDGQTHVSIEPLIAINKNNPPAPDNIQTTDCTNCFLDRWQDRGTLMALQHIITPDPKLVVLNLSRQNLSKPLWALQQRDRLDQLA